MRYEFVRGQQAERHSVEGGESTVFLATAVNTDGRVAIFDSTLPKGNSAPWHYHDNDDEIFYVVAGSLEFGVADEVIVAVPGDLVIAGPGVPRRFIALEDSRFIVINAPAGPAEGFLREVMQLEGPPTAADQARFSAQYGIHFGKPDPD